MKKYKITVLVCLILVVSLLIALVVVSSMDEEKTTLPTWEQSSTDYITSKSSVGTILSTIESEGKVSVDLDYCDVYTFTNKEEDDLLVNCGDVVLPGTLFFEDESILNKNLGRVESINISEDIIRIDVSNFEYLKCQLSIPQSEACDIIIGQEALITFNDYLFEGQVCEKDYILNDEGFLNVEVSINRNDTIIVNAIVTVDIIILKKENVLMIPTDALITEQNCYYVDVLASDNKVERREVVVGIFGDEFVEIKSGLFSGEDVLINKYE